MGVFRLPLLSSLLLVSLIAQHITIISCSSRLGCTTNPGICDLNEFCDNRYPSGLCTWDAKLYTYEEDDDAKAIKDADFDLLPLEQRRQSLIERSALHKVCSFLHPPTARPWAAAPQALRRLFGRPTIDWNLVEQYATKQHWSGQNQLDSLDPYTGCILELLVILHRQPDLFERLTKGDETRSEFGESNDKMDEGELEDSDQGKVNALNFFQQTHGVSNLNKEPINLEQLSPYGLDGSISGDAHFARYKGRQVKRAFRSSVSHLNQLTGQEDQNNAQDSIANPIINSILTNNAHGSEDDDLINDNNNNNFDDSTLIKPIDSDVDKDKSLPYRPVKKFSLSSADSSTSQFSANEAPTAVESKGIELRAFLNEIVNKLLGNSKDLEKPKAEETDNLNESNALATNDQTNSNLNKQLLENEINDNLNPAMETDDNEEDADKDTLQLLDIDPELNSRLLASLLPSKKLDQKKPGPMDQRLKQLNEDEAELAASVKRAESKSELDATVQLLQKDNRPVEEGEVHVELDATGRHVQHVSPALVGEHTAFAAVDSSYAFIYVQLTSTNNRQRVQRQKVYDIINWMERQLNLPKGSFSNVQVNPVTKQRDKQQLTQIARSLPNDFVYAITFKVNPNKQELDAHDVSILIENQKEVLERQFGVHVLKTGIGDKVHIDAVNLYRSSKYRAYESYLLYLLAFVCALACVVALGYELQKCQDNRLANKLAFLHFWTPPTDQTKAALEGKAFHSADMEKQTIEYQDLCRQRMRQNETKDESSGEKIKPKSPEKSSENKQTGSPISGQDSLTRSASVQEEEPLVCAALNMDISTGHLILQYMEKHLSGEKLTEEWKALEAAANACEFSQAAALLPANRTKNRRPDDKQQLPFDHSRVLLNDLHSAKGGDYMNASLLVDADPSRAAYVAAQAPLSHTQADFWQMIWEQDCRVLVSLVAPNEKDCPPYWPASGARRFGPLELRLVSEHFWTDAYIVRSFVLRHTPSGDTRTLTQLNLLCWPEDDLPPVDALLAFRRKVNKCYRGKSSPILVHCSDGMGRTGCYCLLDMVLNRLAKGAKEIDVAATLEHLRDQRPGMVASSAQFEFCLRAIAQEVNNMLRCLQNAN